MSKIPNMNQMMKMAQNMAREMEEKMNALEIEGNSGGGMVKVVMNGHKNILSLSIAREVVDPGDVEMLQDLILAATNEALKNIQEMVGREMSKLTGGMSIPGLM